MWNFEGAICREQASRPLPAQQNRGRDGIRHLLQNETGANEGIERRGRAHVDAANDEDDARISSKRIDWHLEARVQTHDVLGAYESIVARKGPG